MYYGKIGDITADEGVLDGISAFTSHLHANLPDCDVSTEVAFYGEILGATVRGYIFGSARWNISVAVPFSVKIVPGWGVQQSTLSGLFEPTALWLYERGKCSQAYPEFVARLRDIGAERPWILYDSVGVLLTADDDCGKAILHGITGYGVSRLLAKQDFDGVSIGVGASTAEIASALERVSSAVRSKRVEMLNTLFEALSVLKTLTSGDGDNDEFPF